MKTEKLMMICVLCLIASCSTKPKISFEGKLADSQQFDTVSLEMQPYQLDVEPLYPWSCCFLDSLLVVMEYYGVVKDNFFKVYYDGKLISEFGHNGNGSDDFARPRLISEGKAEEGSFWTTEGTRFSKISIDANYSPVKQNFQIPADLLLANDVLLFNDSVIVSTQTGDFQLIRYNNETKKSKGFNYFEDPGSFCNYTKFSLAYQLYLSSTTSNDKYAVIGYQYLKMIDIISLSDMSLHKRICFSGYDINDYVVDNKGNFIFDDNTLRKMFSFVVAGEDSFYALCWDGTRQEIGRGEVSSVIYEFDYDGNILKQYNPNVTISSFAVKDRLINAIVFDNETGEYVLCKGFLK